MSTSAFADWMGATQARVERALARHLPPADSIPARLHDAMRYATLGGGKRVRPLLAFAAGELSGATPEKLEVARSLARMGVDIIEAGFPAASPDDLEAVRRVAAEHTGLQDGLRGYTRSASHA